MFPAEIFSRTPCISISVHVSVIFEPWKWTMVQEKPPQKKTGELSLTCMRDVGICAQSSSFNFKL